ncbi:hypothetical protein RchiOBHm_Chr3g0485701 [Rosa chinensis]|uniref:60S ribosomal export protein NMD3 n=1 Tax=Rosa chinensis TaxID=74649 RepID=A0A2P6RF21_ROSCH|nr:hypothetical protein RchiOBHm_Chr3g0485701 [Rosa chinensis]
MDIDTGMFTVPQTVGSVLCCKCGIHMAPNAANMCVKFVNEGISYPPVHTSLSPEVDITEGLQEHVTIVHCPECDTYFQPLRTWIKAQLESKELLTFCVKRLKNLNKITLVHAESLILKHGAVASAIKITQMDQCIDFFFSTRSHGVKFVGKVAPVRSFEISPICREDLIFLPPKVRSSFGNLGPLMICTKVTNNIALLHPLTLRHCFLDADQYWRLTFKSLQTSRELVEYIVLDVEMVSFEVIVGGTRYALADAQVARVSDFGKNDTIFNIKIHIGHLLNLGDYALGYDLYGANSNDEELDKYKGLVIPDVILIKKSYEEKHLKKRAKPCAWMLKSLAMEVDAKGRGALEKEALEYEQFLKDLEENPDFRFNIDLYCDEEYQPSEIASMTDGEDAPSVPFDELLADMDNLKLREYEDDEDSGSMRE